jgi:hypothetical protein
VFDLRYHVWSLAAVFLALVIGILVGVGLSGSGVTKNADLKIAQRDRDKAIAQRDALKKQRDELRKTESAFSIAYPAVMRDLLRGKRVAVLFVGPVDGGIVRAIDKTLSDANAPPPLRMRSIIVPIDSQKLDDTLFSRGAQFIPYIGDDKVDLLARDLAAEFVGGGKTPLWNALGKNLVEERTGNVRQPADAVIVVRTAKPQRGETARFLHGLFSGLSISGAPSVGVEQTNENRSAVPIFKATGLSSVDDVDLDTGRAALALLLAGAEGGQYGVKGTASAILPPLPGA